MLVNIIDFDDNEKCEDCNNLPVSTIHKGIITDHQIKKLCYPCFKKREQSIIEKEICDCPMGSGRFGLKPGVVGNKCCRCGKHVDNT